MVGIMEFFSAPGFHKPFQAKAFQAHWIVGVVYKLHSMTGTVLFFSSCLVFIKELMDDHIHCIQDGAGEDGGKITETAFNSYCYISSTFTLPNPKARAAMDLARGRGTYPGVGPSNSNDYHSGTFHNYYQWVPYLLFIQSLSFFAPLMIHRFIQDGRVQRVIQDLHNIVAYSETRDDMYGDIWVFFRDWYCHQTWWAIKLVMVDSLNLINILCNIFFVDWYLGHNFLLFGARSIRAMASNNDFAPDPFDDIFPKMTKCSLFTFGPSGTVQNHDALCIMSANVLNEKIYFVVWFLFLFLSVFTLIHHTIAFIIMSSRSIRNSFICLYISPERKDQKKKLKKILEMTQFGDWMMLYMLAKNTDRVIFGQIVENLKYPDYHHSLEELDEENQKILESRNYKTANQVYADMKSMKMKYNR
ncbi:innexin inx2-like [Tigriopus californicus]|uniref:innexin inx2-like n=1 Tax=Tigriopus californicus TaxID=6832 RepID=UPI0027DA31F5|nr:innexin inx2-like [Tigriopus californicus]